MLTDLRFVMGSVAKKDFLPSLKHFRIENGEIRAFNGTIALGAPINIDLNCAPGATPFFKAIQNCPAEIGLHMTEKGRLAVKSGSFKAFIDCVEGETPHVRPEGEDLVIDGEAILRALKALTPFIGDDASRPWSNGVLFSKQSAFATNNVIAVEYWVGTQFPFEFNIPEVAVIEMLRINEAPISAKFQDNCLSFFYASGRWIRTSLFDCRWPDIRKILDNKSEQQPFDTRVFEALDSIKPFLDKLGRVYFKDGVVSTSEIEGDGASFAIEGLPFVGVYAHDMLTRLKCVATSIDYGAYPKPALFFGDRLRGAIIGMRVYAE